MTVQKILNDNKVIDENVLYKIYSEIQDIGNFPEIHKTLPTDVFNVYSYIYLVSNWKSDGWGNIFESSDTFLPYISQTFEMLELFDLNNAFTDFISIDISKLPDDIISTITYQWEEFENGANDELKRIHDIYEKLEEISGNYWGYASTHNGLTPLITYLENKRNK